MNFYDYINKEYQQDGIEIDNITNTEAIYKAVFESLCKNNPEKFVPKQRTEYLANLIYGYIVNNK